MTIQLIKDRQDQVDRDSLGLVGIHPANENTPVRKTY
jgi:hypothetical protein